MLSELSAALRSNLGAAMNLVPERDKLTILALTRYHPVKQVDGQPKYVAMFNPENWEVQEEQLYDDTQAAASSVQVQRQQNIPGRKLSFDLIIDGTGASGEKREVIEDVQKLQTLTGFNPETHESNKLMVIWGTQLFQGRLRMMKVKYTLFRADGSPLRATVSFQFVEEEEREQGTAREDRRSADLTHIRTVHDNDRLDLLCQQIYQDDRLYWKIAETNGLTTLRQLPPGAQLVFPPIEK